MKLQITFDLSNLEKATTTALPLLELVDAVEIGSLLIYKYGENAITAFRDITPKIPLVADSKIVDFGKESATLMINAGADIITVMAGTKKSSIHNACTTAHNMGKKAYINLLDASSSGQAALEAKSLGGDALVFQLELSEEESALREKWEMVKGNTALPIYLKTPINTEYLERIIPLEPEGIILSITDATIDNAADFITTIQAKLSATSEV